MADAQPINVIGHWFFERNGRLPPERKSRIRFALSRPYDTSDEWVCWEQPTSAEMYAEPLKPNQAFGKTWQEAWTNFKNQQGQ